MLDDCFHLISFLVHFRIRVIDQHKPRSLSPSTSGITYWQIEAEHSILDGTLLLTIWIPLKLIRKNNINKEVFDELLFNVTSKNTNVTFDLECRINADQIQILTFNLRIFGKKNITCFIFSQIDSFEMEKEQIFPVYEHFICVNMLNSSLSCLYFLWK